MDIAWLSYKKTLAVILLASVAACTQPAPPPPPPAVVPVVPPAPPVRPVPPLSSAANMTLPAIMPDGRFETPNYNISDEQAIWHYRMIFSAAAFLCRGPQYLRIADDYNAYIELHKVELKRVYDTIDREYRAQHGRDYQRVRDRDDTNVYNFYSFPPTKFQLCDKIMQLGAQTAFIPKGELTTFSRQALFEIDSIMNDFYVSYAKYQRDLAEWNAIYAPQPMASPNQYQQSPPASPPASPAQSPNG